MKKQLPLDTLERISALTPKSILSINVKIDLLNDGGCLNKHQIDNIFTYINMQCKVTGKIRSKKVYLQSGLDAINSFINASNKSISDFPDLQKVLDSGWSLYDVSYDAFVNGFLTQYIKKAINDEKDEYALGLYCDTAQVVIYDYAGKQFLGWFLYNSNLDKSLAYSKFKV